MTGCSALNCSNSSRRGFRLFRFPTNKDRRKIWKTNCGRDKWEPTSSSHLCEAHFEPSQFEQNRLDGWRKLKPNAVPTIFNTPNPPKTIDETGISNIEILLDEDSANLDSQILNLSELGKTDEENLVLENVHLRGEIEKLRDVLNETTRMMFEEKFRYEQKIQSLEKEIENRDRILDFLSVDQREYLAEQIMKN